jgi:hypothetical protein
MLRSGKYKNRIWIGGTLSTAEEFSGLVCSISPRLFSKGEKADGCAVAATKTVDWQIGR